MRVLLCVLLGMSSPLLPVVSGQSLVPEKPEFNQLVPADAKVEKLAGGFRFIEGPAWNPVDHYLIFSDIPADKIYRLDYGASTALIFREPSHNANGNFYDSAGNLYSCEHGSRTVTVARADGGGKSETLVERFEGKLLNSPNDIVVKNDGTVWFSDPDYGLVKRPREQATNNVYCYDPKTHDLRAVATDFHEPNGLCFSPDEKRLYIADSDKPRHVRVFDVSADNRLSGGSVFCQIDKGAADGMRCDRHGNLFSSADDGVQIFAPDGTRLGKILVPEVPANLCFGGPDWDELFITARTSVYHIRLTTTPPGKPDKAGK